MQNKYNIIIQSASLIGKRQRNEDEIDVVNNLDGNDENIKNIACNVIFDGHGGGDVSKILKNKINVSNYFVHKKTPEIKQTKEYNEHVLNIFKNIQKQLVNSETKANKMGSTCLINLLYYKSGDLCLKNINLGDSRAIICNKYNIAMSLTLDQKPDRWDEKLRIKKNGGTITQDEGDDQRISGLSVSRCFGDLDCNYISQIPEIYDYKIDKEKFIIMGCDGIWDVLSNQMAIDFVLVQLSKINKLENKNLNKSKKNFVNNIAYELANYALELGSADNLSVSIIFFINNL